MTMMHFFVYFFNNHKVSDYRVFLNTISDDHIRTVSLRCAPESHLRTTHLCKTSPKIVCMSGTMFSLEVLGEIPGMEDTSGSSVD